MKKDLDKLSPYSNGGGGDMKGDMVVSEMVFSFFLSVCWKSVNFVAWKINKNDKNQWENF